MHPRGEQPLAIDACWKALNEKSNTVLVAGTGAGKTIMGSFVVDRGFKSEGIKRVLWLQHRDKLTDQNSASCRQVCGPGVSISIFDASTKSISGDVIFGMVQTIVNYVGHLPKFDLIVIDEAHHAPSRTYVKIVSALRDKNPYIKIFGMTATPVRSDKKTMRVMFDNVAYVISIPDLIVNGFLVPPKTFKPFIPGLKEGLSELAVNSSGENEMDDVAQVIDKGVVNSEVVRNWKKRAKNLKTIIFCANVAHCIHVAEAFMSEGISVAMSHSKMKKKDREKQEEMFEKDKAQVLVNVMIMTEGFDDQRIGCVIILRTCGSELTFIQIVGRGLRLLDKKKFPGWIKENCIILDFATSHQSLEQDVAAALIEKKNGKKRKNPMAFKVCPACLASVPSQCLTCAFCGHQFPRPKEKGEATDVEMREVDLLNSSRFAWLDIFKNGRSMMASGFSAFSIAVQPDRNRGGWVAFGKERKRDLEVIGSGDRADALAMANGWLRDREMSAKSRKGSRWMTDRPTEQQEWALARWVARWAKVGPMTRYAAACRINYMEVEQKIIHELDKLSKG